MTRLRAARGWDIWPLRYSGVGEHMVKCRSCGFQSQGRYATASATTIYVDDMCGCATIEAVQNAASKVKE
jgi:hypothetical protein